MDIRWIILFPLLGAALNGLVLRSPNAIVSGIVGTLAAALSFVVSFLSLNKIPENGALSDLWFTWIQAGRIKVDFLLEVTPITGVMLMVVTGIGSLIHLYSIGYMSHDKAPWRFFSYLNLFLASMLTLLLSGDLVGIFMGWEGVGLCSYLLIGFWYGEDKNAAAGMKAFVTNRVGDLGFVFALMLLYAFVGTTNIHSLISFATGGALPTGVASLPTWLWAAVAAGLFWASTGKSAQIPLYIWLPDAMAGPTPVSALIHAATMVTSGIFLTVRIWPIFAGQTDVLHAMLWIGMGTAWLAALIALTQRDIKKVLAYSTVSQLGFMFAALGVGAPAAALFHVVTHACFKALLFLGAGSVIHGMHEKQDLFEMGGLKSKMPITHILFLIATLAIIGFPLTSGFFSKDMILAKAFEAGPVYFVLLLLAALLTAFYMFRLYALAFWGQARSHQASHAHESPAIMWIPLAILGIFSLVVGWVETPAVIGHIEKLTHWVEGSWYGMHPVIEHHVEHPSHMVEWLLILTTSALSIAVAFFSFRRFGGAGKADTTEGTGTFWKLSTNKFYVDEIYQSLFVKPLAAFSDFTVRFIDGTVINGAAHLMDSSARVSGRVLGLLHAGSLQTYAWYLALGTGVAVILSWMVMKA